MPCDRRATVEEHLPSGTARGCVLVVSDHRPLNLGHASMLCRHGYAVYTAVTCTDVPRLFDMFEVGEVDLIVFASLVHGWHHLDGEGRPKEIPETTDPEWHTRNIRLVIDTVFERQKTRPMALIAIELMAFGWYSITADALERIDVAYGTYSVNNPHAIVDFLEM